MSCALADPPMPNIASIAAAASIAMKFAETVMCATSVNLLASFAPLHESRGGLRKDRFYHFVDRALAVGFVGQRPRHCDRRRAPWRNALPDQLAGVDQQAGRDTLFQARRLQMAHLLAQHRELQRDIILDTGLVRDNLDFLVRRRIGEL